MDMTATYVPRAESINLTSVELLLEVGSGGAGVLSPAAAAAASMDRMTTTTIFSTSGLHSSQVQAISVGSQKNVPHLASVIRKSRVSDVVFDYSIAAVGIIITFGLGAMTDVASLKHQLKYPVPLVIGFIVQFLLNPLIAFGIAMSLPVDDSIRFGLLSTTCVPGGGLGLSITSVTEGEMNLSISMNVISMVAMLGTAPLWIFVLGQYFLHLDAHKTIPIYHIEVWLVSVFVAYTGGILTKYLKPNVAEAILNWLLKPLLLLMCILFITLGVYINMYVWNILDIYIILGCTLLPVTGWVLGFFLGLIFRQDGPILEALSLETSSFNNLITVAALRFSLSSRPGDLSSTVPFLVIFTTPGIYIVLSLIKSLRLCIINYLQERRQKQVNRQFSIVSGIINQANITALSAPLFISDILDDEDSSDNKEKVTVL
ncbi:sodium/bile acid cotransporter [Octopus sinensis]|uniref:Sodium/bile acid cotransporter n=1 Tax=Octopus sinensis TaxID=2607531 RepID=A0A6P7SMX4_9MOLL|nr:sodium/bile acid cotransporter [Octopus sinensis]